mmetsp:Transcript_6735/g.11604  ORF Transcript_6735/g.11604 Transcript_6735/m.11604 type:complete len:252 (+) Transcript_6735:68-823(+)
MSITKPSEITPLKGEDEGSSASWREKLENWGPLRKLGDVQLPGANEYRRLLLFFCLFVCSLGCLMAVASLLGAYAAGPNTARGLTWMEIDGHGQLDGVTLYAGVKYVCREVKAGFLCADMSTRKCHANPVFSQFCSECKGHAISLTLPLLAMMGSFAKLVYSSYCRYQGRDSNIEKCEVSLASILGGMACLYTLIGYASTCLQGANEIPQVSVQPGPGYILMMIAAVIKIVAGSVHLALPVVKCKSDIAKV